MPLGRVDVEVAVARWHAERATAVRPPVAVPPPVPERAPAGRWWRTLLRRG